MPQNAPATELGNSKAYQDKLLGLLGTRNPLDVMAATPDFYAKIAREHSPQTLHTRPFEGKWTPCEIIGHMIDSEIVYAYRVRLILCEDKPTILGMDQDKWVAGQHYNERDAAELADTFRNFRTSTVRLWKSMKPADLERVGRHNERGEESLGLMLRMEAGHDLSHIDQVTRYIAAAKRPA